MLEDSSEEQDRKKQRDTNIALLLMAFIPQLKESFHEKFGDSKSLQLSQVIRFCKLKTSSGSSSLVSDALAAQDKRSYQKKGNKGCLICGADCRLSNCSLLKRRLPEARIFKLYPNDKLSAPSSASVAMTDYETPPSRANRKPPTSWLCMLSSTVLS
ncbi:hypothetical protein SMKI_09G2070 [Saccharomyces mikatae IFO 1815]|uniref:Uncharacterized protein n=1 Tax=Saccharomyces mikatae IFO 1815 TaxID=226126 RepID=A0AA35IZH4_SACMI|nr:uncharacterized protein SMKI_08G0020 [Saccharomyces mikatae IFO 1815]XP_056082909.1 uncharacterized protein SMKI_09G2070 [Saccharomyces mikatae IFO 1815]CAI4039339.1 hypothetical protein SMKI_08G0020 [Saccharomyces mikatae IFO 1815]CAI4039795.1 hypothetical protein SMKI_09G2070 [Saccharomyces mikatae IFO 1815]